LNWRRSPSGSRHRRRREGQAALRERIGAEERALERVKRDSCAEGEGPASNGYSKVQKKTIPVGVRTALETHRSIRKNTLRERGRGSACYRQIIKFGAKEKEKGKKKTVELRREAIGLDSPINRKIYYKSNSKPISLKGSLREPLYKGAQTRKKKIPAGSGGKKKCFKHLTVDIERLIRIQFYLDSILVI